MKNLEIIVSETEVQYILPTWLLEVGRLGWPGPSHFSRKLLKLELQTLNIFNSTIGEKHAYRQYRFVPARTSQSESKRELLRSENKQIVGAVATNSWRAMLGIRCRITKYSLIFVRRFFAWFHGCTWNRRCRWTQISMRVVVKWILLPMPRLKWRLPSDVFRPKNISEAISKHQIFQKFPGRACPRSP